VRPKRDTFLYGDGVAEEVSKRAQEDLAKGPACVAEMTVIRHGRIEKRYVVAAAEEADLSERIFDGGASEIKIRRGLAEAIDG